MLLTPKQTMKFLGISRSLCYFLIRNGTIPSIRFGRKIMIPKKALLAWMEKEAKWSIF
ncbi:MAG: helix-turn-helix domain-containing protein [Bacillota bacterium]|nr:helix-turn-helix domain-containing protein [Bacillota bacterium]